MKQLKWAVVLMGCSKKTWLHSRADPDDIVGGAELSIIRSDWAKNHGFRSKTPSYGWAGVDKIICPSARSLSERREMYKIAQTIASALSDMP